MKQLFVITARGGEYEDSWERAEFVTDDEIKGEEFVAAQNKLVAKVIAANEHIEQHMMHWSKQHPCPKQVPFDELVVPSFDGINNKNITAEMRAERDAIRAKNNQMQAEAMAPIQTWYKMQWDIRCKFIDDTFSPDVINGINTYIQNTDWYIEPIAWLE